VQNVHGIFECTLERSWNQNGHNEGALPSGLQRRAIRRVPASGSFAPSSLRDGRVVRVSSEERASVASRRRK
jgi:hypothetical protein